MVPFFPSQAQALPPEFFVSFGFIFALVMLSIFAVPLLVLSAASASKPTSPITTVKGAWYAGWHANNGYSLAAVPWEKYNTMYYAFAVPTDTNSVSLSDSDAELLSQFVSEAQANDVQPHLAVGGWTGSQHISSNVATPKNRTAFAQAVADIVCEYNLAGVQFDWEYPNSQGIGCNTINQNDTANFLSFLQELRANPQTQDIILSAAVSLKPFMDNKGNPSTNVSGFANALDYIAVMNYDVWGSWSASVGPNAPLNDSCAAPADQQGSAVSAVKAWTDAGMPANQIVLGVASYGHSFSVTPDDAIMHGTNMLAQYPKFNASNQPLGDAWDNTGGTDICGVYEGSGGTFNFWGLIDAGFLTNQGNAAKNIYYRFDNCSQTAYVYNKTSQVMISFDNSQAFAAKGHYIKDTGLLGFSMWEAGGDHNNTLLDSISYALEK